MARHSRLLAGGLAAGMLAGPLTAGPAIARALTPAANLQQAIAEAHPGDTIRVGPGAYPGPLAITVPHLTLIGEGRPTLSANGRGSVVTIVADHVTLRGFKLTHSGRSLNGEDAGVKLVDVSGCRVEDNELSDVFFGIDLQRAHHNLLRGNTLAGAAPRGAFEGWGDGVRVWNSSDNRLEGNRLSRFRDGFYMEFAPRNTIVNNEASDNQRYGLHFMYMDDSRFAANRFHHNQAGSVLMYSRRIVLEDNTFGQNRGSVGDGVLFKENNDSLLRHNRIVDNTVGLFLDGSNRNRVEDNVVAGNGWGLLLYASSQDNRLTGNRFVANGYEVAVDMPASRNTLTGNYWSGYQGYDLDGDGHGDTPYAPVSLFAFLAMQYPDLYAFTGSPAVRALDFAQRLVPALAPSSLHDPHPLLTPGRTPHGPH